MNKNHFCKQYGHAFPKKKKKTFCRGVFLLLSSIAIGMDNGPIKRIKGPRDQIWPTSSSKEDPSLGAKFA